MQHAKRSRHALQLGILEWRLARRLEWAYNPSDMFYKVGTWQSPAPGPMGGNQYQCGRMQSNNNHGLRHTKGRSLCFGSLKLGQSGLAGGAAATARGNGVSARHVCSTCGGRSAAADRCVPWAVDWSGSILWARNTGHISADPANLAGVRQATGRPLVSARAGRVRLGCCDGTDSMVAVDIDMNESIYRIWPSDCLSLDIEGINMAGVGGLPQRTPLRNETSSAVPTRSAGDGMR
jgi:hypothetical protein